MSFKVKLFETAKQNMNEPAVTSHGETYTYKELIEFSKVLEPKLKNVKRIGLFFEKSKEYIASVFSVTLTESAFVPLEITAPKERLNYILNDADIEYILTSKEYKKEDLDKLPENISLIYFEDLFSQKKEMIEISQTELLDEPAYVIYTSGSTGNPKGVEVSYNGLLNVIEQQIKITKMDKSKFYLYLSISFDASLSDIYCSFLSASHIHIYDCLKRNAIGLKNYFNEFNITHSDLPPSLLKLFSPEDFTTLKSVIIGGEVADYASVQRFAKAMNIVNVYGPTEATICTSMIVCDGVWSKPLIGHALENVGYRILDENNVEIKKEQIGETGELIITGCQLANGYINNPEMNAKTFVMLENERGELERSYKTGDYVCYNENGLIEFKGRIDRQIKYHGQLINLEEVESAINSISEVKSISVILKNKKMYAYYEGNIKDKEIREELKTKLPVYMIPSFIINKEIPKTVTGKNDGKLLAKEDSQKDELNIIFDLFRNILNAEGLNIEPTDSFIKDLSGDSLDFIQLHLALQQMGINIQYDYLIENNSAQSILDYNEEEIIVDTNFLVKEFDKLEMPNNIRKVEKQENKVALITGATGQLGSLLYRLLEVNGQFDKIYCLVRGKKVSDSIERIVKAVRSHGTDIKGINTSIILGDVTKEKLGLSNEIYNNLIKEVDTVYHCAANVNNILNYSQLFDANVLSSVNIAKFIFDGRDKELHYASTLSVYVSSDRLNDSTFDEVSLENDGHRLYSGYAQTKWLSEYYLNKINEISGNIYSYRFGLLTPLTKCPVNAPKSFLKKCIDDIKDIKVIPASDVDLSMDITPIDIATEAMINISLSDKIERIYHVSSNYQLTLNKMAKLLNVNQKIDVNVWFEKYGDKALAQHMNDLNKPYKKQHNMNIFETTNVNHFDTSNSKDFINEFDVEDYLKKLIV